VVNGKLTAGTWQNAGFVRQNGVVVADEVFGAGLQDTGTIIADDVHLASRGIYISNGSVRVNGTLSLPGSLASGYGISLAAGNTSTTGGVLQANTIYAPDQHQPLGILISNQGTVSATNFQVYSSNIKISGGSTLAVTGQLAVGKNAGDITKISLSGTN